jgi:hypothetical protein
MRTAVVVCGLLAVGPTRADPPPGLACLARHYRVEPHLTDGRWMGRVGTSELPWDDGQTKTLASALDAPDLEDMLARAYVPGAIVPVTDPDRDPGRVRVDVLFSATYDKREVVPLSFLGHRLRVHRAAHAAFGKAETALREAQRRDPSLRAWLGKFSGTFVERKIAGTDRASSHSYGISIDLDAARMHYWRWQRPPTPIEWHNTVPQAIVDAFESAGFVWGGRWYHYDTMHFEYRPELFDPGCAPMVRKTTADGP